MRKFVAGVLVGFVLATTVAVGAVQQVKLIVDGREISFPEAPPQIINDRTMVPARPLAEALGALVEWDNEKRTVVISSKVVASSKEVVLVNGHVALSVLVHRHGMQVTLPEVGKDGVTIVIIELNGHSVKFKLNGTEISGTSDIGLTVKGTFQNNRVFVSEDDLRAAGIIR